MCWKDLVKEHEWTPFYECQTESIEYYKLNVGLSCMWGSGPHILGAQVSYIKKRKRGDWETERREERGKTYLPIFHQQVNPASSVVWSSWNLEERFETRVATIWMVEIRFWAWEMVLVPMNSNDVFWVYFLKFSLFLLPREIV